MPARNRLKEYQAQAYYHVYNRGGNKLPIFHESQDYAVFLSYLKAYLEPKDTLGLQSILVSPVSTTKEKEKALQQLQLNNFYNAIRLHGMCLMDNHFHFLLWQAGERDMDIFMNSLGTRYTQFINKKYQKVGPLYQGVYKAVRLETDEQLLYTTKYIHRNPGSFFRGALETYLYSSYPAYLGRTCIPWIDTKTVLETGNMTPVKYKAFVEDQDNEETMFRILKNRLFDEL